MHTQRDIHITYLYIIIHILDIVPRASRVTGGALSRVAVFCWVALLV